MPADDVVQVVRSLSSAGVRFWLDGGWAVDACLAGQTRRHDDLDLVIDANDLGPALRTLGTLGYVKVDRPEARAWAFMMAAPGGRELDLHVVHLDAQGRGNCGPRKAGNVYPAEALSGRGIIGTTDVPCIGPEWLVRFHAGYPLDETDWADVRALCERFALPIPAVFDPFRAG